MIVLQVNQEQGVIACRPGSCSTLPELAIGTQLRMLPNHACATAAQHKEYNVLPANRVEPMVQWARFGGW